MLTPALKLRGPDPSTRGPNHTPCTIDFGLGNTNATPSPGHIESPTNSHTLHKECLASQRRLTFTPSAANLDTLRMTRHQSLYCFGRFHFGLWPRLKSRLSSSKVALVLPLVLQEVPVARKKLHRGSIVGAVKPGGFRCTACLQCWNFGEKKILLRAKSTALRILSNTSEQHFISVTKQPLSLYTIPHLSPSLRRPTTQLLDPPPHHILLAPFVRE